MIERVISGVVHSYLQFFFKVFPITAPQLRGQITYSPKHGNYTIMGAIISWGAIVGKTFFNDLIQWLRTGFLLFDSILYKSRLEQKLMRICRMLLIVINYTSESFKKFCILSLIAKFCSWHKPPNRLQNSWPPTANIPQPKWSTKKNDFFSFDPVCWLGPGSRFPLLISFWSVLLHKRLSWHTRVEVWWWIFVKNAVKCGEKKSNIEKMV